MSLNEKEAIRNPRLRIQCGIVLAAVFAGFVAHKEINTEPSLVALAGAGILVAMSGLSREFYLSSVEWESLLFFAGLFIMVGALVRTGVVKELADLASHLTHGDAWTATMLILSVSFTLGSFINNVPYAATMTPVVAHVAASIPRAHQFRCAVVGVAVGHRPWWQPHRRRSQREYRRGRDRATRRPSHLLLGLH